MAGTGGSVAIRRRVFSADGVTGPTGDVVFNFVTPFAAVPVINCSIGPGAPADATEARISARSVNACTINVRRSPAIILLGIAVLQAPQPAPGVLVHCVAVEEADV